MIKRAIAIGVLCLAPTFAAAQTADELKQDAATTGDVVTLGMGHGQQRYSPLNKINAGNVKRLVPVWNYSLGDNRGQEAQPLIYKGVMYVTTHDATHAIDAATGRKIWKNKIEYPPETPRIVCCGIVNRGGAIYNGKLFRTTLDANVIAIDMKDGKELWRSNAINFDDGYSMTVAPLVANGVVLTGISGGEYGTRGFIEGRKTWCVSIAVVEDGQPVGRLVFEKMSSPPDVPYGAEGSYATYQGQGLRLSKYFGPTED